MALRNLFIDVSSHQEDSVAYFQLAKAKGVMGVVVKLTEGSEDGSAYVNPRAAAQIRNAAAVGLRVSCYHFARYTSNTDAQNEARFFVKIAKQYGMTSDTRMVDDAEVHSVADYNSATAAFLNEVKALGYTNVGLYSMKSFFTGGILNSHGFGDAKIWDAGYGITDLGIDNAAAWQWTDNGLGMNVDTSYDFDGAFTVGSLNLGTVPSTPIPAPNPVEHVGHPATGTYTVQSGDTLSGIAAKFGTTYQILSAINGIGDPNQIWPGQVLKVTGTVSQESTYYVQAGDTLSSIATKFGTTVSNLVSINHISNPNVIYVGQKIYVGEAKQGQSNAYTVQSGDTLSAIASKFGTTWQALAQKNGLANPNVIYVGQTLTI
ncbi:LysM peptidoglycan-binding domain-containing protein [Limosilactobacillus fermentum]|uniref:LysM peptidoglycan-binding domain-containing protein n=1 Tax=Limosilactobacillus fermentum TaxID=1613 RepID=UPI00062D56D4|nr:LysM peptidoglycan-binding domain-containing protein [Limosilactobacillus fermentum]KLD54307.1 glycoside hydrolase family 25 [Limosilactobacillus fermentum]MCT3438509.1 LysM peptidoglycan-binding domain-containing protein [Limosilactobacillus fermentum]MDC6079208.1 LysM peptidoglycan-binding domain-containing protein [Limosilactobacillus fermentum]